MGAQTRILSIEDDPEMRGLLQLILERKGYHVSGVKRGELGLELLKSLKPDVLLLDLMLPDIDGWEIYRQMKADKELSTVPIIIISARDQKQDAAAGHQVLGNDRYLKKPFEIDELIRTVCAVVEKQPVN
ncbi:MAG: response regulator [Anaerolineae bacterium]|nr:response regulator [Anaerolineae bacterium]